VAALFKVPPHFILLQYVRHHIQALKELAANKYINIQENTFSNCPILIEL
jgi:hypothetical protein